MLLVPIPIQQSIAPSMALRSHLVLPLSPNTSLFSVSVHAPQFISPELALPAKPEKNHSNALCSFPFLQTF